MFHQQIDRNIKAYVNDLLIKSRTVGTFIKYFKKVFRVLQDSRMTLNMEKCVFGVKFRKFFEYMISPRGIEANFDKIKAI